MTVVLVRGTALRWDSDDFPGWVEVAVSDSAGRTHHIIGRVPVLTSRHITCGVGVSHELWLSATFKRMDGDDVIVSFDEVVETIEGLDELAVDADKVRWL